MYYPLFFALPLEIIPVYFGSGSEKLLPTFTCRRHGCVEIACRFAAAYESRMSSGRENAHFLRTYPLLCPHTGLFQFGAMPGSFEH